MESIASPLKVIWSVRKSIEKGASVKRGIQDYLNSDHDEWQSDILKWNLRIQQGATTNEIINLQKTAVRKHLLHLLERGLKGESIYKNLIAMEDEVTNQVEMQIQDLVTKLPYLMLIPIALFFFPACVILMLGPFILQLASSF